MQKIGFIRKLLFISNIMTSQTGQQILTALVLPNISISKVSQVIKFGYLIKCSVINIFFKIHAENEVRRLVLELLLLFKKLYAR